MVGHQAHGRFSRFGKAAESVYVAVLLVLDTTPGGGTGAVLQWWWWGW